MQHLRPLELQESSLIHGGKCTVGEIHHLLERIRGRGTTERRVKCVPDNGHSINYLIVIHGVDDCPFILRPDHFREGAKIETAVILGLDKALKYKG